MPRPLLQSNPTLLSHGVLPLSDLASSHFIGQTSVTFPVEQIWSHLESTLLGENAFNVLIRLGSVVGPNDTTAMSGCTNDPADKQSSNAVDSLAHMMLPHDECTDDIFDYGVSCNHLAKFNRITRAVHRGAFGRTQFNRSSTSGEIELVNFNFAPVLATGLRAINASDFSRGTREFQTPIFAVGLGQADKDVIETFTSVHVELRATLKQALFVLIGVVIAAFAVVVVVSGTVTLSVSVPVAQLSTLVTSINR